MNRIEQLYSEWISLQPLKPEDKRRLDDKFRLEFNYNSNHIEGNTLTYGQTKLLLVFGDTTGNAKLQDYEEMRAHDVGLNIMTQEARDLERPLSEAFIRELNKTILVRPFWKDAVTSGGQPTRMEVKVGEYKSRPNHVQTATGEVFYYATPEETPVMMKELVEWYNIESDKKELSPIELAALLHYRYIRIHPFEDGNGRIARLLVNYVLIRNNYPPVIIQSKDKDNYLRILHQCDVEVGLNASDGASATIDGIKPFVEYINDQLEHSLTLSVKAAKGESIEEEDDFAKRITLLEREARRKVIPVKERSDDDVWDVLEFVYFVIEKRLVEKLSPIKAFFGYTLHTNRLSKGDTSVNLYPVNRTSASLLEKLDIHSAKSIEFKYECSSPKVIKLDDIEITFNITLNEEDYLLSNITQPFSYGSFPSEEQINDLVNYYANKILMKIESQINELK